jgi:hypothetical protein
MNRSRTKSIPVCRDRPLFFFFDKGRELVSKQNPDPAGYSGDVGSYIIGVTKIQEAVGKVQLAYERAVKAEAYEQHGQTADAMEMWRMLFGDYFPAYE